MIDNGRTRLLTPEEEDALCDRVHAGDLSARDELILANVPLVWFILWSRFHRRDEDLDQSGYMGLVAAADRYDRDKHPEVSFATYAVYWIVHHAQLCMDADKLVHIPAYLDRPSAPLTERTKANRKKSEQRAEQARSRAGLPIGLVEAVPGPDSGLLRDEQLVALREALGCLTDLESCYVVLRYGLAGESSHSVTEISSDCGSTRFRVGRILKIALAKLRIQLGDCATP
jgi:RNA polymerase sigma factor (sigma-70 family)